MRWSVISLGILMLSILTFGQDNKSETDTSKIVKPKEEKGKVLEAAKSYFKISGEAGAYGELYAISGRDKRRPPTTGRLFFRPTLTLLENFSISFDLLLSTEGSSARQQINQIALHPTWGWGRAHIGDFNHEFSRYTLGGVTIRGAGVEINPGIFRFQVVGGQTQRAVKAGPYSSAYSRYLGGLKLGIGKNESSFFDINIVRAKDNVKSLPQDIFIEGDTVRGITPQENLVMGINTTIKLFEGKLIFRGEGAGSVFSKDLYSPELELEDVPKFVENFYKPRISTNADYAYSTDLSFNYKIFNTHLAYSVIGPGYTSLGLSSIINDKKAFEGGLGIRLFNNNLILQGMYQNQRDNLVSQKSFTTTRSTYGIIANMRPIKEVSVVLNVLQNEMKNDAVRDTVKIENINTNYSANVAYQFLLFNLNHSITAAYSTQFAKDLNILRKGHDVHSQNINLSITTTINPNWSVSPNASFNNIDIQKQGVTTTSNYNLRVMNKMLSGKLSNSASVGLMNSKVTQSTNITLQSSYSIMPSQSITLNIRSYLYKGKSGSRSFNEHTASAGYVYRF